MPSFVLLNQNTTVPKYQFKYQSFQHERGKSEFEIIFQIPTMAI